MYNVRQFLFECTYLLFCFVKKLDLEVNGIQETCQNLYMETLVTISVPYIGSHQTSLNNKTLSLNSNKKLI